MSTQSSGLRLFWTDFRDNKVALFALHKTPTIWQTSP